MIERLDNRKVIKIMLSPCVVSVGALCISGVALFFAGYTFWDNYFNFKLDVGAGKQVKLWIAHLDKGSDEKGNGVPIILMSLAFTNSGGKTESLQDVKLSVTLTSNKRDLWQKKFESIREYDTILANAPTMKQVEILPIVIVGRTTEIRKYVYFPPIDDIQQSQIPKSFDLTIDVHTKHRGNWKLHKTYEIENISDVWQDLDRQDKWNFSIRDIFEKK